MSVPWQPIHGETPLEDLSGLKQKGISSRTALNAAEAENILDATIKYLADTPTKRIAPFDYHWLQTLHREMFGNVWTWAGKFRTVETNHGLPPAQIPQHIMTLTQDFHVWAMPPIEKATHLHLRAVQIHPFLNGNGRWSRMLANIYLKQIGEPIIHWPENEIGSDQSGIRGAYLRSIKAALKGNMSALLELHRRFQGSGGK